MILFYLVFVNYDSYFQLFMQTKDQEIKENNVV